MAEPPSVEVLFPAGLARGSSSTISVTGKFAAWPPKVWVDRPGLIVEPGDANQLKATAATDAEPGVYWLRLYDATGAAKVRPILVGTLPEVAEVEPNDEREKAQAIAAATTINGRLEKNDDVDIFAVSLKKGETLVARITAHQRLGSPMDASLQICTPTGFVLAQNDDEIGLDPQLVFTAPAEGTYLVQTFGFASQPSTRIGFSGGPNFVYRLTLTTGGLVDHALPLAVSAGKPTKVELRGWNLPEPERMLDITSSSEVESVVAFQPSEAGDVRLPVVVGDSIVAAEDASPEQPQAINLPATISGCIENPRDEDAFRFSATKGMVVSILAESRGLGFTLEPSLRLFDAKGELVKEASSLNGPRDVAFEQTIPADGEYRLVVRDAYRHGGFRYVYRLRIAPAAPDFTISAAAGEYLLAPGKPLEIPLTIARQGGFAGVIDIAAADLPPQVTVTAAKSPGVGTNEVKLTLTATGEAWSGPFRIVGTSTEPQLSRGARFSASDSVQLGQFWLTVLQPQ